MTNRKQNLIDYMKSSSAEKTEYNFLGTPVFIKDPLPEYVLIEDVFAKIQKLIPSFLFYSIDIIYVGEFEAFKQKHVNALFLDGALYVTNQQDNVGDMVDDIIHELAHAIEEQYGREIYEDGKIEEEFLVKRGYLERILRHSGFDTAGYDFMNLDYDIALDKFFLEEVGYAFINTKFSGKAFLDAYSATSLREYFATGFEKYYLGDREQVSYICPILFAKLTEIDDMEE